MLVYTFRTNPLKDKLRKIFPNIFIFGKLNEDFRLFSNLILKENPERIIGIAKSNSSQSEAKAINIFNDKKIDKNGQEKFDLTPIYNFKISSNPSTSFYNWTMYKIAKFIKDRKLNTKLSFIHVREEYLSSFINIFSMPNLNNKNN